GHLKIVFASGIGKKPAKKKNEKSEEDGQPAADAKKYTLRRACLGIGNNFVVKKGLYGHGIVKNFSCYEGEKLLSKRASKDHDWLLRVSEETSGKWNFEMFYGDEKEPQAKLTLPGGEKMIRALN